MDNYNWRARPYPGEENDEFTQAPGGSMGPGQPPVSSTHASPYLYYGHNGANSHNGHFYPQRMTMSTGIMPSASPSRYCASQALPAMSPYDNLPAYGSPHQYFEQPTAKKQKVNEYGAAHSSAFAQPVTPPRRARRGTNVDYSKFFSSPSTDPLSSSPATSVENNPQSSKDPNGELQPFFDAQNPYDPQHRGMQAQGIDVPTKFLDLNTRNRSSALPEDSEFEAEDPVFVPKKPTRRSAAKKTALKSATLPPASKSQNFKKAAARKPTIKKQNSGAATQSGSIRKYLQPANQSQFDVEALAAQFPVFQQHYAALQASEEQDEEDEFSDEENVDVDEVDTNPALLQSFTFLSKPEPAGEPEVFALGRQPLCDALPYYRALQGGCYRTGGVTHGLLISSVVGIRDKFLEEVIITTCGGGREKNAAGEMVQMRDQEEDNNYARCMKGAMAIGQPVGVIAGQANSIAPVKLPHAFNVLAWFHVTDVWMEPRNGFNTWCVRLEKIDLSQPSWWMPNGTPFVECSYTITAPSQVCDQCQQPSKCMFNIGWMCMNTSCPQYFTHPGLNGDQDLDYSTEFLQERTVFTGTPPGPLAPALPTLTNRQRGTEAKYKKGIVCPKCRCCSRRLDWEEWRCENTPCDFVHRIELRAVSAEEAASDGPRKLTKKFAHYCDDRVSSTVDLTLGNYKYSVYHLPGENEGEVAGRVFHVQSNPALNQHEDGPNDLFAQMQTEKFGLKRNPARNAGKTQEVVTNHWTANHGAPYKYFVRQGTSEPFSNAPETVLKAIKRVQWVCEQALEKKVATPDQATLKDSLLPFNEVLSVGYFQTSKMGYHDDGEKELGPTVASISFGAAATMSWRPKKNADIRGGASSAKKTKGDVLKIILRHGDIMIMDGEKIQELYEHQVEAHGKIRFAMTCRHIQLHRIVVKDKKGAKLVKETQDLVEAATKAATMPEGHEKYDYDGNTAIPELLATEKAKKLGAEMGTIGAGQVLAGLIGRDQLLAEFNEAFEAGTSHR